MAFEGTITPRNITQHNLMRGLTDFSRLEQFDLFQKGRPMIKLIEAPRFIEVLAKTDASVANLLANYKRLMEYEFLGLDGLPDITSETTTITDNVKEFNFITKSVEESAVTVSFSGYKERSGSIITKMNNLVLEGIADSATTYKHYYGLIESGKLQKGLENEVFTWLYWVTDETGLGIERASLLASAQPTKADWSQLVNQTRGEIGAVDLTVDFNCFPIHNNAVTQMAIRANRLAAVTRIKDRYNYKATNLPVK